MKRMCKANDCRTLYEADAAHRFGGYCSAECQRRNTPKQAAGWAARPPVNTGMSVLSRPAVKRRNGTDRREISG